MKTFRYVIFIFAVIFFSSCAPIKKISYSLPVERIIERVEENSKSVHVFEANGTISVDSKDFSNSANFDLTIKKPDSLGLNIFGPFGIDVASAVASSKKLIFFNQIAYQVIYANPNKDNLKKILRVNLEFSDLLDILTGNFDFSKLDKSKLTYTTETDSYLLSIDNQDTKIKMWVDVRFMTVSKYLVYDKFGKIIFDVRYSDFDDIAGIIIPKKIKFEKVETREKVEIEYSNIKLNNSEAIISISIPDDVEVIEW